MIKEYKILESGVIKLRKEFICVSLQTGISFSIFIYVFFLLIIKIISLKMAPFFTFSLPIIPSLVLLTYWVYSEKQELIKKIPVWESTSYSIEDDDIYIKNLNDNIRISKNEVNNLFCINDKLIISYTKDATKMTYSLENSVENYEDFLCTLGEIFNIEYHYTRKWLLKGKLILFILSFLSAALFIVSPRFIKLFAGPLCIIFIVFALTFEILIKILKPNESDSNRKKYLYLYLSAVAFSVILLFICSFFMLKVNDII